MQPARVLGLRRSGPRRSSLAGCLACSALPCLSGHAVLGAPELQHELVGVGDLDERRVVVCDIWVRRGRLPPVRGPDRWPGRWKAEVKEPRCRLQANLLQCGQRDDLEHKEQQRRPPATHLACHTCPPQADGGRDAGGDKCEKLGDAARARRGRDAMRNKRMCARELRNLPGLSRMLITDGHVGYPEGFRSVGGCDRQSRRVARRNENAS